MSLHLYVLIFSCAALGTAVWSAPPELPDGQPSVDLDRCAQCKVCDDEYQEDRPCQCDANCGAYGDCCSDCTRERAGATDFEFQCLNIYLNTSIVSSPPTVGATFWMVATCPEFWTAGDSEGGERAEIASGCTGRSDLPPVTDTVTGTVYKNEDCAVCNDIPNPVAWWSYQLECSEPLDDSLFTEGVSVNFNELVTLCPPSHFASPKLKNAPPPRICYPTTCLSRADLKATTGVAYSSEEYSQLLNNCTQGPYSLVRPSCRSRAVYRNQYCARCNGFERELDCYSVGDVDRLFIDCPPIIITVNGTNETIREIIPPPDNPSFSVLLDVNGDGQVVIVSENVEILVNVTCAPNEVFDPVNDVCRPTVCSEEGTCVSLGNSTINCASNTSAIALNASEYEILGNNTILWNGNVEEVQGTSMGRPVICVNFSSNGTRLENRTILIYSYPAGFIVLTYIGGALSIIGCMLVLATYTIFKELRTLPSVILMNIVAAILLYIVFLLVLSPVGRHSQGFCTVVAIAIQLFVLAQFSWMSILLFEMARSFYSASKLAPELSQKTKRCLLFVYMITGWSVPLIITVTTIVVNFTTDFVLYGKTEDGTQGRCWINHPNSLIVAFIVPLSAAFLLNIILFVVVSVFLFKAWRGQTKLKKDKNLPYMRVYLAVFAASGLTWVFGFIALLVGTDWIWYPFIIFNSSQGFWIFLAFLCTKKIAKRYLSFFKCDTIVMTISKRTSKTGVDSRSTSRNGTASAVKLNNYSSQGEPQGQYCDFTTGDSPV